MSRKPAAQRRNGPGVDGAMTIAGAGLAVVCAGFAYVAVQHNDGSPRIHGIEHLAIFAMPNRSREQALISTVGKSAASVPLAEGDILAPGIDFTPTATIKQMPLLYRQVRRVVRDRVVFDGPSGLEEVRMGEIAPGIGRLREIQKVQGRWIAVIEPEPRNTQSSR